MGKSKLLKWIIGIACGIAIIALTSTAISNVKGWFNKGDDSNTSVETSTTAAAELDGYQVI